MSQIDHPQVTNALGLSDIIPFDEIVSQQVANTGLPAPRLRTSGDGFLFGRYQGLQSATARLWHADLLVVDVSGSSEVKVQLSQVLQRPDARSGPDLFIPHPLWAVCPDGTLLLYDPSENAVRQLPGGRTELRAIALPAPRNLRTTQERLARLVYQREVRRSLGQAQMDSATFFSAFQAEFDSFEPRLGRFLPEYVDLHCAETGIWIQPTDPDEGTVGKGPAWIWVTPDTVLKRVRFPADFSPLKFGARRIWGSFPSVTGVPRLGVVLVDDIS